MQLVILQQDPWGVGRVARASPGLDTALFAQNGELSALTWRACKVKALTWRACKAKVYRSLTAV